MRQVWDWIKNNPNRAMFLLPILLVAAISISHVVSWYDMANPINWAIYLSIAIEVAAITALVAATNKIKGGIWFMFGIVTFIQMVGNIFYSFKEIDETGELFKSWVELTGPVWELMGTETTDLVGMKRWLAFLEGGLLPIISLTSLHFFVKYEKPEETKEPTEEEVKKSYYEARNRKMEELVEERKKKESLEVNKDIVTLKDMVDDLIEETSEISEEDSKVEEEESKAESVKATTPPSIETEEYFDEQPDNTLIEDDDLPPNEVLVNALKKYKESRGDMEKLTPNEVKGRIVSQPPKPPKTNIKRID